ncbi:hypothetical protein DL767_002751 [Monosporascus sp. MG133]|nr:hypothetical protein DL767_002751 [Monosporascus sp. MG133]
MASTTSRYEALAEQIESILQHPEAATQIEDEQIRRRLAEGGRKLNIALEDSGATLRRISYVHFQIALACVGIEAGVFAALTSDPQKTFTNGELAEKTAVDPKLLTTDGYSHAVQFFTRVTGPAVLALPDFLQKNRYKDPTGVTPRAFNMGHRTDAHPFAWVQDRPEMMGLFLPWMNIQREGRPAFFDVFDVRKELAQGATSSTPLFVDVGGAMGSQCIVFRQRYPDLPGRVILQDLQHVVDMVKANPLPGFDNIEAEAHDMFKPESVKGARAYYLRNVLHDWPDAEVVKILSSIKTGMTEESVILIDEAVLSERGAPWRAVQQDMEMLACFSAMERTEGEWRKLIDEAGLTTRRVRRYTEEYEDTVIVVALK